MFATCLPGLAPLVRRQLDGLPGITPTGSGFDGRADVVTFEADRGCRDNAARLRTAEDVFAEIGRASRADGDNPHRIAAALWQPQQVERALSMWAEPVWTVPVRDGPVRNGSARAGSRRKLAGTMTFRVVSRVLSEGAFRRTDLRTAVERTIGQDRRKWPLADPAQLEIWACEYQPGQFISGLRLSGAAMRQHGGRALERHGALRPTLAAAMIDLAGEPSGLLLDPCCGSGTILAEAAAAGWTAAGTDIDQDAITTARANAPAATVTIGDALRLDRPDASVAAVVSNLPFGRQYRVEADMGAWLADLLREVARVLTPGGRAVLLTPARAAGLGPASLPPAGQFSVRLLGLRTTIWCFNRL
jgi:SAM-dependent methyltransferase